MCRRLVGVHLNSIRCVLSVANYLSVVSQMLFLGHLCLFLSGLRNAVVVAQRMRSLEVLRLLVKLNHGVRRSTFGLHALHSARKGSVGHTLWEVSHVLHFESGVLQRIRCAHVLLVHHISVRVDVVGIDRQTCP